MSYPTLPQNRLVVGGIDLTTEYGLILEDGYVLEPPSPKTYIINIPGGNGKIDLTDSLTGEVAFDNRKQEFIFHVINPASFESTKRRLSNFLHGNWFEYTMTMDPGYTYRGRFTVSSYVHKMYGNGKVGTIKISVDAEPFKYSGSSVYSVAAVGGTIATFESGRMKVCPTIETPTTTLIIYNKKQISLPKGTWKLNDIMFTAGDNDVYFNTAQIKNLTWGAMRTNQITWGEFKTDELFKWYKSNGDGTYAINTWGMLANETWGAQASKTWSQIQSVYQEVEDVDDVYVQYEVGDL